MPAKQKRNLDRQSQPLRFRAENRPRLSFRLMRQYQGRMICTPSSPGNPLVGSTEAMHLLLRSEYIPSYFSCAMHVIVSRRRSNNKLGTIAFKTEKHAHVAPADPPSLGPYLNDVYTIFGGFGPPPPLSAFWPDS